MNEFNNYKIEYLDSMIKTKAVLEYCEKHIDQMWAAKIVGIHLGCDFRDSKENLKDFWNYCEQQGI